MPSNRKPPIHFIGASDAPEDAQPEIRFLDEPDSSGIHFIDPTQEINITQSNDTGSPAALKFRHEALCGALDRGEMIEQAQALSGMRILDAGSFDDQALAIALASAVMWKTSGSRPRFTQGYADAKEFMPLDSHYLVVGHGFGSGDNWSLVGAGKVQKFVDTHVPKGEKAWVVSCKENEKRKIGMLAGEAVTSNGLYTGINPKTGGSRPDF